MQLIEGPTGYQPTKIFAENKRTYNEALNNSRFQHQLEYINQRIEQQN